MQCLLSCPAVRQSMQRSTSTALKNLCAAYMSTADCNLESLQLQRELGAPYDGPHAQNAIVFLDTIVQHSSELSLQHTVRLHVQCTNCNSASFTDHQQHVIPLSIPASVKSLKFSELMQMYMDWTQSTDQFCDACQHLVKVQNEIVSAKQLLILQVDVWNSVGGNVII